MVTISPNVTNFAKATVKELNSIGSFARINAMKLISKTGLKEDTFEKAKEVSKEIGVNKDTYIGGAIALGVLSIAGKFLFDMSKKLKSIKEDK